ncbi:hypothetical protein CW304_27945 [Bacillus sp. UFRGS-B20]|nr:hypothetical protein CW304_27945 [Bacillus sp. UFRGS-B20]
MDILSIYKWEAYETSKIKKRHLKGGLSSYHCRLRFLRKARYMYISLCDLSLCDRWRHEKSILDTKHKKMVLLLIEVAKFFMGNGYPGLNLCLGRL